ncbi:MAG: hypothetical protein JO171_11180 [Paludibacterium sp.]|uniref:hypothetical protein n=1 Tax=Paludibacterium sp. TaxID=1917523 RepID=UPI0025CF60AC|nr:hypothetical protein [Paludibacterium sp.]MBV8047709.1 hypothetical protein [Paludibacterium sp.]MBV8647805.1 hypothetical protein [Paludibacterium sp.]
MKKYLLAGAAALLLAPACFAGGAVLETPVAYTPDATVVDAVKAECKVEDMLAQDVGGALAKDNDGAGTIDAKADASGKTVLRLRISFVMGVLGGGWTGPKAITVKPQLFENGKMTREGKLTRWSTGGAFAAFKGTCDILKRCSKQIADDMVEWVKDPTYELDDQDPPKDTSAPVAAK